MGTETPARYLKTEQLQRELRSLQEKWDELRSDDTGHGGSPGEWIWERMGEIEHELKRRDREFREQAR